MKLVFNLIYVAVLSVVYSLQCRILADALGRLGREKIATKGDGDRRGE